MKSASNLISSSQIVCGLLACTLILHISQENNPAVVPHENNHTILCPIDITVFVIELCSKLVVSMEYRTVLCELHIFQIHIDQFWLQKAICHPVVAFTVTRAPNSMESSVPISLNLQHNTFINCSNFAAERDKLARKGICTFFTDRVFSNLCTIL